MSRYCLAHAGCPVVAVPPPDLDQAAGHGLRGWAFRNRIVPHGAVPAGRTTGRVQGVRITQLNPRWVDDVSMAWPWRAAGR